MRTISDPEPATEWKRGRRYQRRMNRRQSLLALFAAAPVAAGGVAHAAGKEEGDAKIDTKVLDLSGVVFPIVREGRLVHYLFSSVRIELTDKGNQEAVRQRAHFARDAIIRAVHRTDVSDKADPRKLDRAAAQRVLTAAIEEGLGAGTVRGLIIAPENVLPIR